MRNLMPLLAAVVLGLAGVFAGSGCGEMSTSGQYLTASAVARGAAMNQTDPQRAAAWFVLSDMYGDAAQIEGAREAARESKSEISIYTEGKRQDLRRNPARSNRLQTKRPGGLVFVCTGYKGDLNGDGEINYPEEFDGIGTVFDRKDKKLFVYASFEIDRPYNVSAEILHKGKSIGHVSYNSPSVKEKRFNYMTINVNELPTSGRHIVRLFVDGQYWGATEFNVPNPFEVIFTGKKK